MKRLCERNKTLQRDISVDARETQWSDTMRDVKEKVIRETCTNERSEGEERREEKREEGKAVVRREKGDKRRGKKGMEGERRGNERTR